MGKGPILSALRARPTNTDRAQRLQALPWSMRLSIVVALFAVLVLGTACTESGLAEPIPLPVLPEATELPTATPLTPATALPVATEVPTVSLPDPATELPPATGLPLPVELPTLAPLESATVLPPVEPLPTSGPAPTAPVLPTLLSEPESMGPSVSIGPETWPVELAITPEQRSQGLSGREVLPEGTGMLFIFEHDQHLTFWMPDMNFPLDMVWIDSSCSVVDVTVDAPVPVPGQSRNDLPRFSPQSPARFVLEINAGEFETSGARVGETATFDGELAGQYGC